MPRLNDHGATTDGRQVCWFDQERTISQVCDGGVCRLMLSDGSEVIQRAANDLVASGNGHWAAFLVGFGVYDSYGQRFQESALSSASMSPGGMYARKVLYQSYGPWVLQGHGTQIALTGGDLDYGYAHVSGISDAVWTEGGRLRSNLALADPGCLLWWPVYVGEGMLLFQEQRTGRLVLDGRVIAPSGNYFYPDAKIIGDRIVVAWSPNQGDTQPQVRTFTREELRALPRFNEPEPEPPPPPPPPPEPAMPASLESAVRAERAKYPATLTEDQPAKILNAVAWANRADGWGLSVKPNGHHVMSPQGVFVAYDILHHKPSNTLWGCFTDDLKATVNWGQEAHHNDPNRPWLAPVSPTDEPDNPPPPDPGNGDLATLRRDFEAAIKRLEAADDNILATISTATGGFADVQHKLEELKTRVDNMKPGSGGRIKGRTKPAGTSFLSHSHEIDLPVE